MHGTSSSEQSDVVEQFEYVLSASVMQDSNSLGAMHPVEDQSLVVVVATEPAATMPIKRMEEFLMFADYSLGESRLHGGKCSGRCLQM